MMILMMFLTKTLTVKSTYIMMRSTKAMGTTIMKFDLFEFLLIVISLLIFESEVMIVFRTFDLIFAI